MKNFFKIIKDNVTIFDNIPEKYNKELLRDNTTNKKEKFVVRVEKFSNKESGDTKEYKIIFVGEGSDYIKSKKTLNKEIKNIKWIAKNMSIILEDFVNQMHNVKACHQRLVGEIDYFHVDDREGSKLIKQKIKQKINNNLDEAVSKIFNIKKNETALKLNLKYVGIKLGERLYYRHLNIRDIILQIIPIFYTDFHQNYLTVETLKESSYKRDIDKESFKIALYHFFDNAGKYAKKNSKCSISINENENEPIKITMTSLKIIEKEKIFERSYRGKMAESNHHHGKGLGMYIVQEMLFLNKLNMEVKVKEIGDKEYTKNIFIIKDCPRNEKI